MSLKLFVVLATYVLLTNANNEERKENAESFITKEAAKELRNKLNARGEQQDYDYDEILKKIIMNVQEEPSAIDNSRQNVYEKKYFDYLPNDLDSEDTTDEDSTHELVKTINDFMSREHESDEDNVRRVNSRKFKRDLTSRVKRQSIYFVPVPLTRYAPYPNVDFYFPNDFQAYPVASPLQSRFNGYNYEAPNNPWTPQTNPGKFHTPYNSYLPPSRPGINNPSPPHNPANVPQAIDTGDRGLFEEDDTAQRIWSVFDRRVDGGFSGNSGAFAGAPSAGRPQQGSRPLTTTTRKPSMNSNAIDFEGARPELEIEYPPESYDIPLTTRAPLKKVTSSSQGKNPNRMKNPNRQRTQGTSTVPPTTTVNTTPEINSSLNSRQPNNTLPPCVLAVVNCCSRYDEVVRTPCFEKYNCNGAFFGRSPCSPDVKSAAFREVEKFSQR